MSMIPEPNNQDNSLFRQLGLDNGEGKDKQPVLKIDYHYLILL